MSYRERALKTASLCLLALTALSILAVGLAQAAGNWRVEGTNITKTTEISGEKDKGPYRFLVPTANMELVFENFKLDDGLLFPEFGTGYTEFLFTGGKLYVLGEYVESCEVGDLWFKAQHSLFLHEGKTYDLLKPAEGTVLVATSYSEECALPSKVAVTGSMVLESVTGGFAEEAKSHLVQQAPNILGAGMKFGVHPMSMDGSFSLSLAGGNEGLPWSGLG